MLLVLPLKIPNARKNQLAPTRPEYSRGATGFPRGSGTPVARWRTLPHTCQNDNCTHVTQIRSHPFVDQKTSPDLLEEVFEYGMSGDQIVRPQQVTVALGSSSITRSTCFDLASPWSSSLHMTSPTTIPYASVSYVPTNTGNPDSRAAAPRRDFREHQEASESN